MAAPTADTVQYVSVHGRRLGLVGDGVNVKGLLVDGKFISTRAAVKKVTLGRNGAGAVTLAGAKVGDTVAVVVNLSTPGDGAASFESTITVDGQIQQSSASNLSAVQFLIELSPQS